MAARAPAWDWSPLLEVAKMLRASGRRPPASSEYNDGTGADRGEKLFRGKKCWWAGREGTVTKLYPAEAYPISDNTFDPWKFEYMVNAIRSAERVIFPCCVAVQLSVVDAQDVKESQQYGCSSSPVHVTSGGLNGRIIAQIPGGRVWTKADIGKRSAQVRNGNHRCFAAFAAGEPFVWAYVMED